MKDIFRQFVRHHPTLTTFLFGVFATLAAMLFFVLSDGGVVAADPDGFGLLAQQLLQGHGFGYTTPAGWLPGYERGPVYPLLIAVLSALTGGFALWKVIILHALLHGGTAAFVQRICQKVLPSRLSLLAGMLAVLHPLLLWYALKIWTETLSAFLLIWSIDAIVRWTGKTTARVSLELGVVFALSALTKSNVLLFPFVLVAFKPALGLRVSLRHALLMLAVFIAGVLTWTTRNNIDSGTYLVVHTGLGFNLIEGNQIARSWPEVPLSSLALWDQGLQHVHNLLAGRPGNSYEPGNDLFLVRMALQERMQSPLWGIGGVLTNALTFWYLAETPLKSVLAGCFQIPLLLIACLNARRLWRLHVVFRAALLLLAYFWIEHALIVGWVRYSAPVTPLLILVAVAGVRLRTPGVPDEQTA